MPVAILTGCLQAAFTSPHDCRYKLFIGVGGITCILGGDLQSSSEEVRSVLIIFKLFNVRTDRPKPDVIGPLS